MSFIAFCWGCFLFNKNYMKSFGYLFLSLVVLVFARRRRRGLKDIDLYRRRAATTSC